MSGDASPNLDDGFTSRDARDALIRHGAELRALIALFEEAREEKERHEREMERISEEMSGLMFEIEDLFERFLASDFAEKTLADYEALPETPDERREDGP
jgi:hypothetical protein